MVDTLLVVHPFIHLPSTRIIEGIVGQRGINMAIFLRYEVSKAHISKRAAQQLCVNGVESLNGLETLFLSAASKKVLITESHQWH